MLTIHRRWKHVFVKRRKSSKNFSNISYPVVVEAPHKHHHQGKQFNVRIDIGVPGNEIVVNRDHHEDVYVALRDAFDAAKRQLEDYARITRGYIKTHEPECSEERDNSVLG